MGRRSLMVDRMKDMSLMERIDFSIDKYQKMTGGGESVLGIQDDEDDEAVVVRDHGRKLEDFNQDVWLRQEITFDGCLFQHISFSAVASANSKFGVITIESRYDDLVIENCIFEQNDFGDPNIGVGCV
jgi:hypothetical protein